MSDDTTFQSCLRRAGLAPRRLDTPDQRTAVEHTWRFVDRVLAIDPDGRSPALIFDPTGRVE